MKKSTELIKNLIRNTSLRGLAAMSQKKDIEIAEVTSPQKIMGHWMALISVSGEQLHLTFKVQFSIAMARGFALQKGQTQSQSISNSHSKDFVREFCNLVAGNIKTQLADNKVNVGISLPILSRGFDDLFFDSGDKTLLSTDRWKLAEEGNIIYCASIVEIISEMNLSDKLNEAQSTSGDIEFF